MRSFPVPGNWGMHAERNPVYATYENILFIMYKKPSEQSTPAVFYNLCRFVNDVLHIRESEKHLFRRAPVERTHREIVVFTLVNG